MNTTRTLTRPAIRPHRNSWGYLFKCLFYETVTDVLRFINRNADEASFETTRKEFFDDYTASERRVMDRAAGRGTGAIVARMKRALLVLLTIATAGKENDMFSPTLKHDIANAVQEILKATQHGELPRGEISFILHVDGAEDWSWANIRNNGDRDLPVPNNMDRNLTVK